jgi:serine phosphatase RsbU (regulator of sigma subunit)
MRTVQRLTPETGAAPDFKALYRKLESTLAKIERTDDRTVLLETVLRTLVHDFRDDLGFEMGRLYMRDGDDFELCCAVGGIGPAPIGRRVPPGYPPHERTLREGIVVMHRGEAGFDEEFERAIGVTTTFAAIAVGPGDRHSHVLAFTVGGAIHEEQILYSLTAVRHVINLKLAERKLSSLLEEARVIQESLLPPPSPSIPGFDAHGISRAAERVGGDFFDFLALPNGSFGIAIADSSGHGLPAALLARDAVTGLRLLAEDRLPPARLIARLNRVIHRAALSSRFLSLFYAELRPDGFLTYCNAGHVPPLLRRDRKLQTLRRGGLILGPSADAHYAAGRTRLRPGDALILVTDGVTEQRDARGEEFGERALPRHLRGTQDLPAIALATGLLEELDRFSVGSPPLDDQTVVAIRRLPLL